jgi:hypothetical protein
MNIEIIKYNSDYINDLEAKGNYRKSNAFFNYFHNTNNGRYHTERVNASRWNVSVSTAHEWTKDFDLIINQTYFFLLSEPPSS